MTNSKLVRLVIYLEPSQEAYIRREAKRRRTSVSEMVRSMLAEGQLVPVDREDYLRLAVNVLLKYHPTNNLTPVVEQEWLNRRMPGHG